MDQHGLLLIGGAVAVASHAVAVWIAASDRNPGWGPWALYLTAMGALYSAVTWSYLELVLHARTADQHLLMLRIAGVPILLHPAILLLWWLREQHRQARFDARQIAAYRECFDAASPSREAP